MEEICDYFSVLPEVCISDILSRTSPPDAIRSSAVSSAFKSAADSDIVWQKFLPSDYQQIISRSVSPVVYSSKKDLYFRLCHSPPILIDDSKLISNTSPWNLCEFSVHGLAVIGKFTMISRSFSLDKRSGKKCYMIRAKELTITRGGTPNYSTWSSSSLSESRFMEVAELRRELRDVCWLDIRGKMDTKVLSPNTTYTCYHVFKTLEKSYGLDSAKAYVRLVREIDENRAVNEATTVHLEPARSGRVHNGRLPQRREDGWMEIELGEFYNDQGDDGELEMRLKKIVRLLGKSGLNVEGMELRPKDNA